MPSGRGLVVFAGGIALWLAARAIGSPDLHMVAVGVTILPFASALFARWSRARLTVTRRLSHTKVRPGQRITVELEVENAAAAPTSFILVEDQLPPTLGRPARLVLSGIPGRNSQRVTYSLVCRTRGRFSIGPLRMDLSDPFALTKVRLEFGDRDDLVVFPEVEELDRAPSSQYGSGAGESASRQLFRTAEEFYTMREYVLGDDLRRIHWPSVARRGKLMIRQDESARPTPSRSNARSRWRRRSGSTSPAAGSPSDWRPGSSVRCTCRRTPFSNRSRRSPTPRPARSAACSSRCGPPRCPRPPWWWSPRRRSRPRWPRWSASGPCSARRSRRSSIRSIPPRCPRGSGTPWSRRPPPPGSR